MTTPTTQFAPSRRMGIYEPLNQLSMWEHTFDGNIRPGTGVCIITEADTKLDDKTDKSLEHAEDSHASRNISEKIQRRLAQNREAARKSRLRKKAYVQQLETSRLKLAQLELELERARQQGLLTANKEISGTVNSGIGAFEIEYGQWIEEQERKMFELRNALHSPIGDIELRMIVENVLNHYCNLFRMKRDAAIADAFYLVSGMWRSPVEHFFHWIGGFRPSELISVVMPHLGPLTEQQIANVGNLKHSCTQAEDALSQGMEKLQQTGTEHNVSCCCCRSRKLQLSDDFSSRQVGVCEKLCARGLPFAFSSSSHLPIYCPVFLSIYEFIILILCQADHIREQTLQQMSRFLTTRQAAKGLLAFGQYFQSLRALSSLWSARSPLEPR